MLTEHAPTRAERMQAIYDQVPPIPDCRGHCWISCGPANMLPWERRRLALAGHPVTPEEDARRQITDYWCEALGPDGRCRAYAIRPLICRLWAAVEWLPCPYGCQPEGGFMPNATAFRLLLEATALGGTGKPVTPDMFARLDDPAEVAELTVILVGKDNCDMTRFRHYGGRLPPEITRRRP